MGGCKISGSKLYCLQPYEYVGWRLNDENKKLSGLNKNLIGGCLNTKSVF